MGWHMHLHALANASVGKCMVLACTVNRAVLMGNPVQLGGFMEKHLHMAGGQVTKPYCSYPHAMLYAVCAENQQGHVVCKDAAGPLWHAETHAH